MMGFFSSLFKSAFETWLESAFDEAYKAEFDAYINYVISPRGMAPSRVRRKISRDETN